MGHYLGGVSEEHIRQVSDYSHCYQRRGRDQTKALLASAWVRSCVLLTGCTLLLLFLYWPSVRSLVAAWRTSTFSHGFLVVPTTLYLAWARRKRLAELAPMPTFWALPLLASLSFGWLLGELTSTNVLQHFCLIAMVVVTTWGLFGTVVARALLLPLAFLLFAVPLGAGLIPALQDFTARFAVKMLDLTGVPVLLEGHFLTVPSGSWEVAEACSGIRYLTSSVAIGFLFAGLMYRTWTRRLSFLLASAIVPILANGLRVYGIVLLAYHSGNRLAAGVDHLLYGWLFFTFVMLLLLGVGGWWREPKEQIPPDLTVSARGVSDAELLRVSAKRELMFAAMSFLVIAAFPIAPRLLWRQPSERVQASPAPPLAALPWHPTNGEYGWRPGFAAPSAEVLQSYASGPRVVQLYIAYYAPARLDAKLVSSENSLFDRQVWSRTGEARTAVSIEGQSFRARQTLIRSEHRSLVIWNWYWIDDRFTGSDPFAKALLAKARLLHGREGTAAIVVATEDPNNEQLAEDTFKDFLNHVLLREGLRMQARQE